MVDSLNEIDFLLDNLASCIDDSIPLLKELECDNEDEKLYANIKVTFDETESIINSNSGKKLLNYNLVQFKLLFSYTEENDGPMPFSHYIETANNFDLDNADLKGIVDAIESSVAGIFVKNETENSYEFLAPGSQSSYSAIIGPSFMGKTQLSFILARERPVFYFNFSASDNLQPVYKRFQPLQTVIAEYINADERHFGVNFESNVIYAQRNIKLQTIGFIWELILYASKFQGDYSNGEWFDYYLTSRTGSFEPLSLNEFYILMKKFVDGNLNFKIPFIFIDELPTMSKSKIKFLRNVTRCLVLPCILSSTNANVSNMLNLNTTSSSGENNKLVNGVIRLLESNLKGILNTLRIGSSHITLISFVDDNFNLKGTIGQNPVIGLLDNLEIECDEINRVLLLKIWKFMKCQAVTNLQGTSFYSFHYFASVLAEKSGTRLNSKELWISICSKIATSFRNRKATAFTNQGRFFSLRMFSKVLKYDGKPEQNTEAENEEISANNPEVEEQSPDIQEVMGQNQEEEYDDDKEEVDDEKEALNEEDDGVVKKQEDVKTIYENRVRCSIDKHFYYFGEGDESTNVLSFDCGPEGELQLNGNEYFLKSYHKRFEDDFFTAMALWTAPATEYKDTIAKIVKVHEQNFARIPVNGEASKKDFKSQEAMAHWAAAHSSHQNYSGATPAIDFIKTFAENVQLRVGREYPKLSELPMSLFRFLHSWTVPYLVPYDPNHSFRSSLEGLCKIGTCSRCANKVGFDISLDLFSGNDIFPRKCFIECKYTEKSQKIGDVKVYSARAKSRKLPLSIFLTFNLSDIFKRGNNIEDVLGLAPKPVRIASTTSKTSEDPGTKMRRTIDEFKMSAYSIYLTGGELVSHTLYEGESDPDGIFLIVETNYDVFKN